MLSKAIRTKRRVVEQPSGKHAAGGCEGLVEAALEGRLGLDDGTLHARKRIPALDLHPEAEAVQSNSDPVLVPRAKREDSGPLRGTSPARHASRETRRGKLLRALGFLAVVLGTLLLADILRAD